MYYVKFFTGEDKTVAYRLKNYNSDVKKSLGFISMLGCDVVELVFKGEIIEKDFEFVSLKNKINEFVKEDFHDVYFNEIPKDEMKEIISIAKEVAID
ncbi:hypothetical protein [Paraliobacillus ryukyuensis]|uniref:hypothetical protein n=1 Tax=Paraliobacillus ryukyuensis TaxID=200904 RepID=UPI0009A6B23A|nr:hypothetical protein [Paraliobacillus ryukyuensis]